MDMITIIVGIIAGGRAGTSFSALPPIRISSNCLTNNKKFEAALSIISEGGPCNAEEVTMIKEECASVDIAVEFIEGREYCNSYVLNMSTDYATMRKALRSDTVGSTWDVFGEGSIAMAVEGTATDDDLANACRKQMLEG